MDSNNLSRVKYPQCVQLIAKNTDEQLYQSSSLKSMKPSHIWHTLRRIEKFSWMPKKKQDTQTTDYGPDSRGMEYTNSVIGWAGSLQNPIWCMYKSTNLFDASLDIPKLRIYSILMMEYYCLLPFSFWGQPWFESGRNYRRIKPKDFPHIKRWAETQARGTDLVDSFQRHGETVVNLYWTIE